MFYLKAMAAFLSTLGRVKGGLLLASNERHGTGWPVGIFYLRVGFLSVPLRSYGLSNILWT